MESKKLIAIKHFHRLRTVLVILIPTTTQLIIVIVSTSSVDHQAWGGGGGGWDGNQDSKAKQLENRSKT